MNKRDRNTNTIKQEVELQ